MSKHNANGPAAMYILKKSRERALKRAMIAVPLLLAIGFVAGYLIGRLS